MKKVIYLLFIILSQYNVYSQNQDIFGRWNNVEREANISAIEFKSDNIAILFQGENTSPFFNFTLDNGKNPIWIDMLGEKDGVQVEIFGLLEFIDSDKIKIEMFNHIYKGHPDKFSSQESSMSQVYILNRVK
ncbi:hypothetical protein [Flavobacterium aquidurense]|uniref:Uncharacterized protein n=1 Tax=Flavobacterium aquidurense TaxID=362413 RepID=A0A0Q0WUI0_9FLAO|nr:hypothetical protein [Flavobacterium aquidurense]KQB39819.1 hypothetical protein RC62_1513 [Flavobacterium aquidurense]